MTMHLISSSRDRGLVAALVALSITAACATSSGSDGSATPSTTTTPGSSLTSDSSTVEGDVEGDIAPIEGTWRTPPLTHGVFRRALSEQGLGVHSDAFVSDLGNRVDLTLEIAEGFWTLYTGMDGQARAVTDRGTYVLQGTRVMVRPNSGGENVFRWSVDGDKLALALVSTTEPPYEGVPAETYQRGFYTTSTFTKQPS